MLPSRVRRLISVAILLLIIPFLLGSSIGCSVGKRCDYRCKCLRKCGGAGVCYDKCLNEY